MDRNDYDSVDTECQDCHGEPFGDNARVIMSRTGDDGRPVVETIWHTRDCPAYTVQQIFLEEGARRSKVRSEWEKEQWPETVKRFRSVLVTAPERSFVRALSELVEAQGKAQEEGRVLLLSDWIGVLEKHFPGPDGPALPPEM